VGWRANEGAQFHYVSASPWQLYPALAEFRRTNGFPAGTFHLKTFRWKDESFFDLVQSLLEYKLGVLEPVEPHFSLELYRERLGSRQIAGADRNLRRMIPSS
jgi:hypothetical protein